MDSDILLKDDGTAEITGDRFNVSVGEVQLMFYGGHLTSAKGNVELCSDMKTLKLAASEFELYYNGGHLLAKGKQVELGSTDSGALKGFVQSADGSVKLTGDATTVWAKNRAAVQGSDVQIDAVNSATLSGHAVRSNSYVANGDGSYASALIDLSGGKLHAEVGKTPSAAAANFSGSSTFDLAKDKFQVESPAIQLGTHVGSQFTGFSLSAAGLHCKVPAVSVVSPSVTPPDSQQRLALLQSADDELVFNAGAHYTGGARVEGKLSLAGEVLANGELKISPTGKLLILQADRFAQTTTVPPRKIRIPGQTVDVLQAITALQAAVRDLTDRLAALEAPVH